MLYGLLVTLFVISCVFLLLLIMIQQGKGGGIGFGSFSGSQTLFGGSGGQDLFQKITWAFGAIFMVGSLGLALLKTHSSRSSRYLSNLAQHAPVHNVPVAPAPTPENMPQA